MPAAAATSRDAEDIRDGSSVRISLVTVPRSRPVSRDIPSTPPQRSMMSAWSSLPRFVRGTLVRGRPVRFTLLVMRRRVAAAAT